MTPEVRQQYLRALDIPEFLTSAVANKKSIKCLAIESRDEGSVCRPGQSYDLFEKMLAAIGLSMVDVHCLNVTNKELLGVIDANPAQVVLMMDRFPALGLGNSFNLHHPQEILNNPALKREAWEVLKKVAKCLR